MVRMKHKISGAGGMEYRGRKLGIRVHSENKCQPILNPEVLPSLGLESQTWVAFGQSFNYPIPSSDLVNVGSSLLAQVVAVYMADNPTSDLWALLIGEKSFENAIRD
jgi:hypothetical protein